MVLGISFLAVVAVILAFRKQFNDAVFGGNGSGKTTFMIKVAISYMKKYTKKRVLFIIPDDSESKLDVVPEISVEEIGTFQGIAKLIVEDDSVFEYILNYFGNKKNKFNGLMIIDDPGVFLKRRPERVLKLFRRRRQVNIDFLWGFHGLKTEMPPAFFAYLNRIYLLETSDNHKYTMDLLPDAKKTEFEQKYQKVQNLAAQGVKYHMEEIVIRSTV